jgi:hypothetical protein
VCVVRGVPHPRCAALAQNEIKFKSFREFKNSYFKFYVDMCRRLTKEGKVMPEYKEQLKVRVTALVLCVCARR